MSQTPDYWMAIPLLAAGLIIVAGGIGVHTFLKERNQRITFGNVASLFWALMWLLLLAGFCLMVVLPAVWYFPSNADWGTGHDETHQIATTNNVDESSLSISSDAESTATPERPAWVDAGEVIDGSRRLVVVQGQQFPQEQRARNDAMQEAVQLVRMDFLQAHNAPGRWKLSPALVKASAVKKTFVEPIQRSTGLNEFSVVRVYHQVELSDDVRDAVFTSWRSQMVDSRLWILGGLLGFITLMLGTAATYLRLDMLTNGNYRRRLKLASVSLIVAGGLGLAAFLPLA